LRIPFCDECGSKLAAKSKFCQKCGAAVNAQSEAESAKATDASEASKAVVGSTQPKQPNTATKVLGILLGLMLGAIILFAVIGYTESNVVPLGFDYNGNGSGVTKICSDRTGSITCGYCDAGALSGNAYAGKCRYCPDGYACSGEICSTELTCKPAKPSPVHPSTQPSSIPSAPQPSGVPTVNPTSNPTINPTYGGGGTLTNFDFDARTGCPVQGSTSSWGSSNLQCSQWIEATRCNIQSCSCIYPQRTGQVVRAYYHTSDGAYFPCSGVDQTLSCTNAAIAAAEHCGPTPAPNIVWGS